MKHFLIEPDNCVDCEFQNSEKEPHCILCDGGLGQCAMCGMAEAGLSEPCPGPMRNGERISDQEISLATGFIVQHYKDRLFVPLNELVEKVAQRWRLLRAQEMGIVEEKPFLHPRTGIMGYRLTQAGYRIRAHWQQRQQQKGENG